MKLDTPRAKIEMLGMIHPGPSPMLPENGSLTVSLPTVGSSRPACVAVDWGLVVARVKNGEDGATEQLYKLSNKGIRYNIFLHLGSQDLEDKVHDIFLIVVNAIQGSLLRKPDRLMGFVRAVVRRQVAAHIKRKILGRREQANMDTVGMLLPDTTKDPEQIAMLHQEAEVLETALSGLSQRDREILIRFYLQEQPQGQICREMQMTATQFRLIKSRAKAKFGQIGKKHLATRGVWPDPVRDSHRSLNGYLLGADTGRTTASLPGSMGLATTA